MKIFKEEKYNYLINNNKSSFYNKNLHIILKKYNHIKEQFNKNNKKSKDFK